MTPREAFETLGLPLAATPLEAKAAWRGLARTLHSDFHQDKDAQQREVLEDSLRRANAAWECLEQFFELPAAQRARILGTLPVEPVRPVAYTPPPPEPRLRRGKRVRRTPWWVLVPAALVPLGVAGYFLMEQINASHEPAARSLLAAATYSGTFGETGDPAQWIGKEVVIATCSSKGACSDPDCSAGPLLKSLREFYGFKDAFILYGYPDSRKTGLMFNEVLTAPRNDRFSVHPIVISTDGLADANRRTEGNLDPNNACRFSFKGPVTITGYGGSLSSESRVDGDPQEMVLQLDELHQNGDDDSVSAEFVDRHGEARYGFEYGARREAMVGPAVANAPQYASDVGSLYRVKFRRVEYRRGDETFAANHEFLAVTRLTGERESAQYRGVPLMANPRKGIRKLEQVDLPGIRQCQVTVSDPAVYTACALRLILRLEASGRLKPIESHELRFRFRNLSIE
jgi:hypothetical protein